MYYIGKREYIGQNLNEKWLDMIKNEDFVQVVNDIAGGAALESNFYVFVQASGTPQENAVELQEAYDLAKSRVATYGDQAVLVAPGDFDFASDFLADADQVSIACLLDTLPGISFTGVGNINVTGQFCGYIGIDTGNKPFIVGDNVGSGFLNCVGGNGSFGNGVNSVGYFENCEGGDNSFGANATASGQYIKCIGEGNCFGSFGTASGTFTDCVADFNSFGSSGIASGVFENCNGGFNSFAGNDGEASGTFINCTGGDVCFGTQQVGTGIASGTFINCRAGYYGFAGYGTASGTFINCVSYGESFGRYGTLTGQLYYCIIREYETFETVSGAGVTVLCIDGSNQINTQN